MAKSDSIQFKYREILAAPETLEMFHTSNCHNYLYLQKKDELAELTEQLTDAVKDLIENKLTSRQSEVVKKIYFEKKTQMEVADSLGLCQTTVHKILKGNIDYMNNKNRYGGALKKLNKLCTSDPVINQILEDIKQIRAELVDQTV